MSLTPTDLLDQYWERGRLPIDPATILRRMGYAIEYTAFADDSVSDIDGTTVRVQHNASPQRINFALAHCLGHICLNHLAHVPAHHPARQPAAIHHIVRHDAPLPWTVPPRR